MSVVRTAPGSPRTNPREHREGRAARRARSSPRRRIARSLSGGRLARAVGPGVAPALLWFSALAPAAVAQESATALRALERAAERYREVNAICGDFEQVIEVRLLGRRVESAGRVCQQRPNLFSMRFSDPGGDMVISDGRDFWVYYPSIDDRQVMRHPAAESPGRHDFFREFLEDPARKYSAEDGGTEEVDGRGCRVVSLTPVAGAAYRGARLWLDAEDHLIRRLELHEESGNVRTVTLSNLDLAPALDADLFNFEVPEGARVMGPRPSPLSGSRAADGSRDREPRRFRPPSIAP